MCSLTDGHCNMTSLFYSCILCSRAEMRLTHANFVLLHGRESDTVFSGLFGTETFHSPAAIDKTIRRERVLEEAAFARASLLREQ